MGMGLDGTYYEGIEGIHLLIQMMINGYVFELLGSLMVILEHDVDYEPLLIFHVQY